MYDYIPLPPPPEAPASLNIMFKHGTSGRAVEHGMMTYYRPGVGHAEKGHSPGWAERALQFTGGGGGTLRGGVGGGVLSTTVLGGDGTWPGGLGGGGVTTGGPRGRGDWTSGLGGGGLTIGGLGGEAS
jgi:hypothetical protein